MTITPFHNQHTQAFSDLLAAYFPEMDADIPPDIIRGKLLDLILDQHRRGILHILLVFQENACIGFSIFQRDIPDSDWCKRPGWGFIREFYIAPDHRHQGFGTVLAAHSEQTLRNTGAQNLYLTADSGIPFWTSCGWRQTEDTASNNLIILEK